MANRKLPESKKRKALHLSFGPEIYRELQALPEGTKSEFVEGVLLEKLEQLNKK